MGEDTRLPRGILAVRFVVACIGVPNILLGERQENEPASAAHTHGLGLFFVVHATGSGSSSATADAAGGVPLGSGGASGSIGTGAAYAIFELDITSATSPRSNIKECRLTITDQDGNIVLDNFLLPAVAGADSAGNPVLVSGCASGLTSATGFRTSRGARVLYREGAREGGPRVLYRGREGEGEGEGARGASYLDRPSCSRAAIP